MTGAEDGSAIALSIDTGLTDTDGSETLLLTFSVDNAPAEAQFLHDGQPMDYDASTGTWSVELTQAQLAAGALDTLTFAAGEDNNGTYRVTVTAAGKESDGQTATEISDTFDITVSPTAEEAEVTVGDDITVVEDANNTGTLEVPLSITVTSDDNGDLLSVTIDGVPDGASLSAGSETAGTWTVTADDLPGLKLILPDGWSGDLPLDVTSLAQDGGSTVEGTASQTVTVSVTPVADMPDLDPQNVGGAEGDAVALDLGAALNDTDGSESLTLTFTTPDRGTIKHAGAALSGDSITFSQAEIEAGALDEFTFEAGATASGAFDIQVKATATESAGGSASTETKTFTITVDPVANAPTLTYDEDATVADAGTVTLGIGAGLTDTDGSESLTVTITGISGGTLALSDGTPLSVGDVIAEADLAGVTFTAPGDATDGQVFQVEVTAAATEQSNSHTTTTTKTIDITVEAVDDGDGGSTITGLVVDPYIAGATVFLDMDGDGQHDAGEPTTTTDAEGAYTFEDVEGAEDVQVVAYGGTDTGTGLALQGQMSGTAGGVTTPLTTLMATLVDSGAAADAGAAQTWVAQAFGLDLSGLDITVFDPVAAAEAGDAQGLAVLEAGMVVQSVLTMTGAALTAADPGLSTDAAMDAAGQALVATGGALETVADFSALISAAAGAAGLDATAHAALDAVTAEVADAMAAAVGAFGDVSDVDGLASVAAEAQGSTASTIASAVMNAEAVDEVSEEGEDAAEADAAADAKADETEGEASGELAEDDPASAEAGDDMDMVADPAIDDEKAEEGADSSADDLGEDEIAGEDLPQDDDGAENGSDVDAGDDVGDDVMDDSSMTLDDILAAMDTGRHRLGRDGHRRSRH